MQRDAQARICLLQHHEADLSRFKDEYKYLQARGSRQAIINISNRERTSMRKIEAMMNVAIQGDKNFTRDNTMVHHVDGVAQVLLHGNLIAEVGEDWMKLYDGGWQSNTTKSRLNAILSQFGLDGERVFQKNFEWLFQHRDGSTQPFRSGMRLAQELEDTYREVQRNLLTTSLFSDIINI